MKKSLLLSIPFIFSIVIGYSQDKGYVAISAGPSFPSGDFGSSNTYNEAAGLANTGAIVDITYAQKFGKTFGITVLLRGQTNGVETSSLLWRIRTEIPWVNWSAESGNWRIGGFMGGIYSSIPLGGGKFCFASRAMLGYLNATSPEITLNGSYPELHFHAWSRIGSGQAGAFAWLLGAGFRFNMGQHLCLLTNVDYLGSKPEFEDVVTEDSFGGYNKDTYSQTFGTVNVGVGIGWRW